ncbi:MAG: NnrU family protein, partial [Burkholderiales bacterium]
LNDVIATVAGLGLYLAFVFWAHAWLFGVRPFG